jgi:carbonic anhydrase
MSHLYARTQKFLETDYQTRRELFAELATGQAPKTMMVTCSDSRINPSLVTQTEPGELFLVRNAGNLVAPFSEGSESSGEWATIEYALSVLKVSEVIVCGHSDCGAMKAVLGGQPTGLKAVDAWLQHAARPHQGCCLDSLITLNVKTQVENLMSHPTVREAVEAGRLTLHGWVYHIGSGKVEEVPFGELASTR